MVRPTKADATHGVHAADPHRLGDTIWGVCHSRGGRDDVDVFFGLGRAEPRVVGAGPRHARIPLVAP